jgi:hypothetical protein
MITWTVKLREMTTHCYTVSPIAQMRGVWTTYDRGLALELSEAEHGSSSMVKDVEES